MNTSTPQTLAHQTWQTCLSVLKPQIASNLIAREDDGNFRKNNDTVDIIRLRILPSSKAPLRFWSSKWCFYELGIGMYDGSPLVLGGISFFQFSDQAVCGSGHYYRAILEILSAAQKKRPQDFDIGLTTSKGARMPVIARRYRATKAQKLFPAQTAAKDLAWLIQETLPKFECLTSTQK